MMQLVRSLVIVGAICASTSVVSAQAIDWQKVDDVFGRKPAAVAGDVHRYGFARTDLNVTLDGVAVKPALALGGWVAFKPIHGEALVMGDLVLLEAEINPVMTKLIENGIEITAVHNHLLRANPATFYLHVGGHGDPIKLATAIHDALSVSKTPLQPPASSAQPPAIDLDTAQLDQIIAPRGKPTLAFISSVCHGAIRSRWTGCRSHRLVRWGWRPELVSSRPVVAKRRSRAIS
jgi:hypothetical protein